MCTTAVHVDDDMHKSGENLGARVLVSGYWFLDAGY
jgi:hypothetical protein